jgi:glycosyltransferase involved in cell wall biosynthesis
MLSVGLCAKTGHQVVDQGLGISAVSGGGPNRDDASPFAVEETSPPHGTSGGVLSISANLDPCEVEIVVCIPTFRRPDSLRRTLRSLADQRVQFRFGCVIVENDSTYRQGAAVAAEFFKSGLLVGFCVLEPVRGNCMAINCAFTAARDVFVDAHYLGMIDDDEYADGEWLARLVQTADCSGADVVGGPVFPQFELPSKAHLAAHPSFRPPYDRSGKVPIVYGTGNCLIRRRVFERLETPLFDLSFNYLGGGDTDFFTRCRAISLQFYWDQSAVVFECVPPRRTRLSWLIARGLRIGAINYLVERKRAKNVSHHMVIACKSLAILCLSSLRIPVLLVTSPVRVAAIHPLLVGCGRLLAALGAVPEQYRHPEKN